jgi:FkbH-like protein
MNPSLSPSSEQSATSRPGLAAALQRNRTAASICLTESLTRYRQATLPSERDFIYQESLSLIEYLIRYFQTGDRTWADLYIGEKLNQLYSSDCTVEQSIERRASVLAADSAGLHALLAPHLKQSDLAELHRELAAIERTLCAKGSRQVRVLVVGDCLFPDILAFLTAPLLEDGITLHPHFLTSKNPAEIRSAICRLAADGQTFDLVFFSPFTYEFHLQYNQSSRLSRALTGRAGLRKLAAEAYASVEPTLLLLADSFPVPIFLHNSANIRRHVGFPIDQLRALITLPARHTAAREVNRLLEECRAALNAARSQPVVLVDESRIVQKHGDLALSRFFYKTQFQHPARLGRELAVQYRDLVVSSQHLLGKKVLVTDLDNTLWNGVIGDGPVEHYRERQRILKQLRAKGVLLAAASKNDPNNVVWQGSELNEADFVALEINWEPKRRSLENIASALNLKLKDFVFIDDRPDERKLVAMALPEVHNLDATDERSWSALRCWAEILPRQAEGDRTELYRARKQRSEFLESRAQSGVEDAALRELGLSLVIREATKNDLPRAAELINRTNQFNTTGCRTTEKQVEFWHKSGEHRILIAEAADQFGKHGIVSVVILATEGAALRIVAWVLSCRVFGFGMETAILNRIKRLSSQLPSHSIEGLLSETPHNQPCRDVYAANGFKLVGSHWVFSGGQPIVDPPWIAIEAPPLKQPVRSSAPVVAEAWARDPELG